MSTHPERDDDRGTQPRPDEVHGEETIAFRDPTASSWQESSDSPEQSFPAAPGPDPAPGFRDAAPTFPAPPGPTSSDPYGAQPGPGATAAPAPGQGGTDQERAYPAPEPPGYDAPPAPFPTAPPGGHTPYGGQESYAPQPPTAPPYAQQPYGAPQYGAPQYGAQPYAAPGAPAENNTSAIVLTVVSGISLVVCGGLLCIPALVMGIMALTKQQQEPARSRDLTRKGWIAYWVGLALSLLFVVLFFVLFAVAGAQTGDF